MSKPKGPPPWAVEKLVACVGGPLDGRWYFLHEWEHELRIVERMRYPADHPAAVCVHYRDGGRHVAHPQVFDVSGAAYQWKEPDA